MSKKNQTPKTVHIVARYFIKRNGAVVYLVRSSNGTDQYTTTIVNGHATGCTCPAVKPCYHMTQLEHREAERQPAAQPVVERAREAVATAQATVARIQQETAVMMARTDAARASADARQRRLATTQAERDAETASASLRYSYGYHDEF